LTVAPVRWPSSRHSSATRALGLPQRSSDAAAPSARVSTPAICSSKPWTCLVRASQQAVKTRAPKPAGAGGPGLASRHDQRQQHIRRVRRANGAGLRAGERSRRLELFRSGCDGEHSQHLGRSGSAWPTHRTDASAPGACSSIPCSDAAGGRRTERFARRLPNRCGVGERDGRGPGPKCGRVDAGVRRLVSRRWTAQRVDPGRLPGAWPVRRPRTV
jgi:hypothetical protein